MLIPTLAQHPTNSTSLCSFVKCPPIQPIGPAILRSGDILEVYLNALPPVDHLSGGGGQGHTLSFPWSGLVCHKRDNELTVAMDSYMAGS